jgi:hypothetical protein
MRYFIDQAHTTLANFDASSTVHRYTATGWACRPDTGGAGRWRQIPAG